MSFDFIKFPRKISHPVYFILFSNKNSKLIFPRTLVHIVLSSLTERTKKKKKKSSYLSFRQYFQIPVRLKRTEKRNKQFICPHTHKSPLHRRNIEYLPRSAHIIHRRFSHCAQRFKSRSIIRSSHSLLDRRSRKSLPLYLASKSNCPLFKFPSSQSEGSLEASRFDSWNCRRSCTSSWAIGNDSHCQGWQGQGWSLAWIQPDRIQSFDTWRVQAVDSRKFPILLSLHESVWRLSRYSNAIWVNDERSKLATGNGALSLRACSERGWLEFSSSSPA